MSRSTHKAARPSSASASRTTGNVQQRCKAVCSIFERLLIVFEQFSAPLRGVSGPPGHPPPSKCLWRAPEELFRGVRGGR
eukprot:15098047-Alexandrium_andersonii.AAC.1